MAGVPIFGLNKIAMYLSGTGRLGDGGGLTTCRAAGI